MTGFSCLFHCCCCCCSFAKQLWPIPSTTKTEASMFFAVRNTNNFWGSTNNQTSFPRLWRTSKFETSDTTLDILRCCLLRALTLNLLRCSWEDAAKFLTGFSAVGSIAIPAILHHAGMITAGAMIFEFMAFAVLCLTVLLFQRASSEDDWSWSLDTLASPNPHYSRFVN